MSELPERIWLTGFVKDEYGARLGRGTISDLDHGQNPDYPEYVRADRIEELEAKLAKAMLALDEAIYLLDPDDEDIAKETGLHRIATTYAELTGGDDE